LPAPWCSSFVRRRGQRCVGANGHASGALCYSANSQRRRGGDELFGGKPVAEFFAACHGADRKGVSGLGLPLLSNVLTAGDDFYFDTIKNGRTGTVMSSRGAIDLSDEEITALVAFIRTAL
jgi:cytochrome c553